MNLTKLLEDAFEAGENLTNSGEFAYYAPSFTEWYKSIEGDLVSTLKKESDDLIRFVIRQWASLNEQEEPDHENLVNRFFENELKEYFQKQADKEYEPKG